LIYAVYILIYAVYILIYAVYILIFYLKKQRDILYQDVGISLYPVLAYIPVLVSSLDVVALNLLTPNVNYSGRTAPLTSKVAFYIFIQQI